MPDDSDPQPDPGSPDAGTAGAAPGQAGPSAGGPTGPVGTTGGLGAGGLPPQGAPGAQPTPALGSQVNGVRRVQLAIKLIETTVPMFGSHTQEGKVVMDVLNKLSKHFGADGSRGQDPMDAVMRRQIMANRAQPPSGPPGAGPPPGMPGAPPGAAGAPPGAPPGGAGPLPMPNRGPIPMPRVA